MKLEILKRHERKQLRELLEDKFGYKGELDYSFLKSEKNKIWIVNKAVSKLNLRELEVAQVGLYFCRTDFKEIKRFSVEGSQLIGPRASKRVFEVSEAQVKEWIKGKNLKLQESPEYYGLVLVKCNEDFFGSGRIAGNQVWNHLSNERRIR